MIFNEVYIGRTDQIQDMRNTLAEARALYINKKYGQCRQKLGEVETIIENFFGFESFSLDIYPDPTINAFTYPTVTSIDIDISEALYTTSKEGYKFKKDAHVAAISKITAGLFGNTNFTDDEMFAIFLHEIGHSFVTRSPLMDAQFELYKTQLTSTVILEVMLNVAKGIIIAFGKWGGTPGKILRALAIRNTTKNTAAVISTTNNGIKQFCAEFQKKIRKYPALNGTQFYLNKLTRFIDRQFENVYDFFGTITGINLLDAKLKQYQASVIDPDNRPNAQMRSWERLSDDFATVYGYGAELSTALLKFENSAYFKDSAYDWFKHNFPIVKQLTEKRYEILKDCIYEIDCHPSTPDRINSIIENMEHDIKSEKNLKPKEKKMLMDSLKQTKQLAKDAAKAQGELAKNPDASDVARLVLGFKKGSSEGKSEREYTDMDALDAQFKELQEENATIINMDLLGYDLL